MQSEPSGIEADKLLLNRIALGDRAAFEDLYKTYEHRVGGYLYRMLGDPEAVAEALNDVMVTVWKEAGRFEARASASTWILGIAHHKALARRRAMGRDRTVELKETHDPADTAAGPQEQAERSDLEAQLENALEELSEEHREVIQLTFFQGLSYIEIAEVAGCPVNTVKTRMFHAKKKLQPILERLGLPGGNT